MNEMIPILWRWLLENFTIVKSFTFRPFIRGFPSYEWNETYALTMTGCKVYYREKFHFFKSES